MENMDHDLLIMKNIVKRFPGVEALKKVNFQLKPGEIVSLIGENGAGKSTLMSVIGGVYKPEEGDIYINNKKVTLDSPAVAKMNGIGYVHQEPTLAPNMTGTENLFLGQEKTNRWLMMDSDLMANKAKKILRQIGITFNPEKLVEDMNMAEKEAIEIAKAMLQRPRILILDEVTAPLDQIGVEHLFQVIRELKKSGIGIIFISHRLQEIFQISDRIVVLRDGKIVGTLDPKTSDQNKLIQLMIGPDSCINSVSSTSRVGNCGEELMRIKGLNCNGTKDNGDLVVHKNEILGLAGLKGAGRSQLGMMLFGLADKNNSQLVMKGKPIQINSPSQAISNGIGYIPKDRQYQGLALIRNIEENTNITMLGRLSSALGVLKNKRLVKNTRELIEQLQIKTPTMSQLVNFLSGGNQQKVMIAKWLVMGLDLLIIDEPTRGVDVKSKADIHSLLIELRNQGMGIIVISSELPELLTVSDRIIVMNNGVISTEIDHQDATEELCLQCMHISLEEATNLEENI